MRSNIEQAEKASEEARMLAAPYSYTRTTAAMVREIVFTKSALAQLIAHVSQKAREAALEEFLTDTQNGCDHYSEHYQLALSVEPQGFIAWLPKELQRKRELRALNAEIDAEIASKRSALKDQPLPTEVKNG